VTPDLLGSVPPLATLTPLDHSAAPPSGTGGDIEIATRWWKSPWLVLGVAIAAWVVMFGIVIVNHHRYFGTFAFDLGIFDQSVWLMGQGEGFNTVRGLHTWGHHASVGYYLFVPFYWLGAGPLFLDLSQLVILGLGAVPVFLLGRDLLKNEWVALVPALAFLIHPSNQWFLREGFHPEVVAITPFLFAVLAAHRRRWGQYALWLGLAVSFKEDIAIAAAMFGVILLIRGRRRVGVVTVVAALGWLAVVSTVVIPAYSPAGDFYGQFYGDFGDTPTDVAWSVVTRPGDTIDRLDDAGFFGYLRKIGGPLGLLALLSPLTLLIGAPQVLINLLSLQSFTWSTWYHYSALPLLAFTVATVEGLARIRRRALLTGALVGLAAVSVTCAVVMGVSPLSEYHRQGYWALEPNSRQELLEQAVTYPGPADSVAASYNLLTHLSHRRQIYLFPNPWMSLDWGVAAENPHDPATVQWLVVDRDTLDPAEAEELERILDASWVIHIDEAGVLVAERSQ
jgi:uncharacterized membrane protein